MIEATHADEYKAIQDAMSDTFDHCEKYLADSLVELVKLRKKIANGELVEIVRCMHCINFNYDSYCSNHKRKCGVQDYCSDGEVKI